MKELQTMSFTVNGFALTAQFSTASMELIWKPLIQKLRACYEQKQKRIIVFLVAPPAVGKSTLAQMIEYWAQQDGQEPIQSIGLDGFHYPQSYLTTHFIERDGNKVCMRDVKGCPETFDIERIQQTLQQMQHEDVYWPVYDRVLHDVIDNVIDVNKNIILIEGNWLLLKDTAWKSLRNASDYTIFIRADEAILKQRLIHRKMQGGSSEEAAKAFYEASDRCNIIRVLQDSQKADLTLYQRADFDYDKEG